MTPPDRSAPHLSLVTPGTADQRCCPICAADRQLDDPTCPDCHMARPPTGWARIMTKGASKLDDGSGWAIEASLRAKGPALRSRASRAIDGTTTVGVMSWVSDPALFTTFEDRARTLTEVRHPSIRSPIQTGRHRGRPYRIDRLQPSPRLITCIGDHDINESIRLTRELAHGLARLHTHGLVHGDVCPRSVALVDDPNGLVAVLVEPPGVAVGPWLPFAAPEVVRGGIADPRSDVFGLGLVLWSLVTGKDPHNASRITWADERPGPVVAIPDSIGISPAHNDLLRRMLDRTPGARPQSMAEVIAALHGAPAAAATAPTAAAAAAPPPTAGPSSGTLLKLGGIALGAMTAAAAGIVFMWVANQPAEQSETALVSAPAEPAPVVADAAPPVEPEAPIEPIAEPVVPDEPEVPAPPDAPIEAAPPAATAEPSRPRTRRSEPTRREPRRTEASRSAPESGSSAPPDVEASPPPEPEPEPEAAPEPEASTPPPEPAAPPPPSADILNGRWTGMVNGRPATVQLIANPDGTLSGIAEVRVGARTEQHRIYGKYKLGTTGSASISLGLSGTRTAWSGRLSSGQLRGAVIVSGKTRGDFALTR